MPMDIIRSRTKSTFTLVLFGLIIISFVFWGAFEIGVPQPTNALTTVNGEEISYTEFQRLLSQQNQAYGELMQQEGMGEQMQEFLEAQVASMLVTRKLMAQEAKRLGIRISDREILDQLKEIEAFQDPQLNRFSPSHYREVLRANRMKPRDFEESIKEELAAERLRQLLQQSVSVSHPEVLEYHLQQEFHLNLEVAAITADRLVDQGVLSINEEEMREHYETRKGEYLTGETRNLEVARFDIYEFVENLEISASEVEAYYEANVANSTDSRWNQPRARALHILASEESANPQQKLQELRRQLEGFSEQELAHEFRRLARQHSEDYSSSYKGGDLGYFNKDEMVEQFTEAVFNAQSSQLVGPIQSDFGHHLIYVRDVADETNTLANREPEIRYLLKNQRRDEKLEEVRQWLNSDWAGYKKDQLDELEDRGFELIETGFIGKNDRPEQVPYSIVQDAFDAAPGRWQTPEEFEDKLYLYRVKEVREAQPLSYEEAKSDIRRRLQSQKTEERTRQWKEQLQSGEMSWGEVAAKGAEVKEYEEFHVLSEREIPDWPASNRALRAARQLSPDQNFGGPVMWEDEWLLFYGSDFHQPELELSASEMQKLREELLTERQMEFMEQYIDDLLASASIPEEFRQRYNL